MTNERHEKALEAAEWIEHDGKGSPVEIGTTVQYQMRMDSRERAEKTKPELSDALRWRHQGDAYDITHYRIPSKAPNHFTNGE